MLMYCFGHRGKKDGDNKRMKAPLGSSQQKHSFTLKATWFKLNFLRDDPMYTCSECKKNSTETNLERGQFTLVPPGVRIPRMVKILSICRQSCTQPWAALH